MAIIDVHTSRNYILYLNIINKCNLKCKYCIAKRSINKNNLIDNKILMDLKFYKRIIINGGEPTLHPNINNIINILHNKTNDLVMYSNGFFLKKLGRALEKIDRLTISLYGTQSLHNETVRNNQAFKKQLSAIKLANKHNVKVEVKIILHNKMDKYEIEQLLNYTLENITFSTIVFSGLLPFKYKKNKYTTNDWNLETIRYISDFIRTHDLHFKFTDIPICYLIREPITIRPWTKELTIDYLDPELRSPISRDYWKNYNLLNDECNNCAFHDVCGSVLFRYQALNYKHNTFYTSME